ncbi:MAG: S-layer homology domain-containing protein, partial [Eubacteriales bacterium]|nr:S-layer homology domain-containing protein [Eubacteriales bacterium]
MKKRSVLAVVLAVMMVLSSFSMVFADGYSTTFEDMPADWSTTALQAAVDNDLLKGYAEGSKTLIKPNQPLTRAEMATVVNRAFGATGKANISKVTDVASWQWFAPEIAKAVQMQTFALADKMRPNDKITRQEAFAVLSRAFKTAVSDTDYSALNAFSDKASISSWALADLTGLKEAGYIEGSNGKLNPLGNITRAEFATVMN